MLFMLEPYPLLYALFLSANGIVTWVVIGMVFAWRIGPDSGVGRSTP